MAKKDKNPKADSSVGRKIIALNRKARRDYEVVDTLEAGIVLKGSEVKAVRDGGFNFSDSYVRLIKGELFLIGGHISPYAHAPADAHEALRQRKLLLHKKEIEKLGMQVQQKGLTIVPLQVYFKNGRCKLEIGLGKGKKLYDKRADVSKRQADRAIERVMKRQNV